VRRRGLRRADAKRGGPCCPMAVAIHRPYQLWPDDSLARGAAARPTTGESVHAIAQARQLARSG
jgi:hypothetical protein